MTSTSWTKTAILRQWRVHCDSFKTTRVLEENHAETISTTAGRMKEWLSPKSEIKQEERVAGISQITPATTVEIKGTTPRLVQNLQWKSAVNSEWTMHM